MAFTGGSWRFAARLLRSLPVLFLVVLMPARAFAACDSTANPVVVGTSCEDLLINTTKSNVTIEQPATVSPFFSPYDAVLINSNGRVTGTLLNKGTITSGFGRNGLVNEGQIANLVNEGTIVNLSTSANQAAVINSGEIGSFTNSGTISATEGNFGSGAHAIIPGGHIGTLTKPLPTFFYFG